MSHEHMEWKSTYALGIPDIDNQHHFFLDLINRLSDELGRADNVEYQEALILELNAYARFHFVSEENIMRRSGYPGLQEHKKLHANLLGQLSIKEVELDIEKSRRRVNEIIQFLVDWFMHHTTVEDKYFADWMLASSKS